MKPRATYCLIALLLFLGARSGQALNYAPGELLVKFKPAVTESLSPSLRQLNARFGAKKMSRVFKPSRPGKAVPPQLANIYKLTFPRGVDPREAAKGYAKDPAVEYAEPNYLYRTFAPNDPFYLEYPNSPNQWYLFKTGLLPLTFETSAWRLSTGESAVKIAVIDTGVAWDHPDLAANVEVGWDFTDINTAEYIADGFTLDPEEDYVDRDSDPMDRHGHGTHCSGIAAASTDNGVGVAGAGWHCRVLAVRAGFKIKPPGYASFVGMLENDDCAAAIQYAADQGARILSLSWGGDTSLTIKNAIDYAHAQDCLIIASAGNSNTSDNTYSYPAAYPNVLAIAATATNDAKASYSNYGNWIDLAAPGGDGGGTGRMLSTYLDGNYAWMNGTSMAAPLVAGIAALVRSRFPALTNEEVTARLTATADNIDTLNPSYVGQLGAGRVNAARALDNEGPEISVLSPSAGEIVIGGERATITWTASDEGFGISPESLSVFYSTDGGASFPNLIAASISNEGSLSWNVPTIDASAVRIKISALDIIGNPGAGVTAGNFSIDSNAPATPSIDPFPSPTNLTSLTLTGSNCPDAALLLINDSSSGIDRPTGVSWSYTAALAPGNNLFSLKARDSVGHESAPLDISITVQAMTFADAGKGISLTFPIGSTMVTPAISFDQLSATEVPRPFPAARKLAGQAIKINSNLASLVSPATITLDQPAGPLQVEPYYWHAAGRSWRQDGLTVTGRGATSLTFTTSHLSIFALFGVSGLLSDILVYPNPFRRESSAGVIFNGLAGSETVRIYTLAGEPVNARQMSGETSWLWEAQNAAGRPVARGVYIYLITNARGERRSGKIAVVE